MFIGLFLQLNSSLNLLTLLQVLVSFILCLNLSQFQPLCQFSCHCDNLLEFLFICYIRIFFYKYIVVYLLLPRLLLFIYRPVGMPKMEKVYLHNPSSEEISLISISATTAHFHASFFQNRVSTYHFKSSCKYWFIFVISPVVTTNLIYFCNKNFGNAYYPVIIEKQSVPLIVSHVCWSH